jgi:hypothetical protein
VGPLRKMIVWRLMEIPIGRGGQFLYSGRSGRSGLTKDRDPAPR